MSNLLLVINLLESRIQKKLVLETYSVFKIRKLKSRKFSGQRTKIDIFSHQDFNNIDSLLLRKLKDSLHSHGNIQINYYQYLISSDGLKKMMFSEYINFLFFISEDKHLYNLNNVIIQDESDDFLLSVNDFILTVVPKKTSKYNNDIGMNFYIDLDNMKAQFFFVDENREKNIISIINKVEKLSNNDYFLVKNCMSILKKSNWIKQGDSFLYRGNDFFKTINDFSENGINVFTSNRNEKIIAGKIKNQSISYDMDWFELKGEISFDESSIDLSKLIDLNTKKDKWIHVSGRIIILPKELHKNLSILSKTGEDSRVRINKKYVGQVLALSSSIGINEIKNLGRLTDYSKIKLSIDISIKNLLKDYQITGVQWLLYLYKNGFGGCLADDMGLGKTLQVIAFLSDKNFINTNNLIIVPKTLLENWRREIIKFWPKCDYYIYHGNKRDKNKLIESNVIITTYGMVINDYEILKNIKFHNIIIDEAQNIKNLKTTSYYAISNLLSITKILLTGTPIENNILELWSLMHLINPNIFQNNKKSFFQNNNQESDISQIKKIVSPFILRRVKEEVLKELPQKEEQIIYCSMENSQLQLYNKLLTSIRYEIKRKTSRYEIKSSSIMLEGLLHLQQVCCNPRLLPRELNKDNILDSCKTEVLLDLVYNLYLNNHKIVVFSRFTQMLKIIENLLIQNNIKYFYLDGKVNNRLSVVENFERNKEGVFLISLKAGGTGLTLTSADTAIIYDPWWNPAIEKQAEDRIYRIGQTKNITIYRLIVANSIEEKIQELKIKKHELATTILENEDTISGIDLKNLKDLLF